MHKNNSQIHYIIYQHKWVINNKKKLIRKVKQVNKKRNKEIYRKIWHGLVEVLINFNIYIVINLLITDITAQCLFYSEFSKLKYRLM